MYIYQDGRLYIQKGNGLVGVDIYPHKVVRVAGTETKLGKSFRKLTSFEVKCKYQIDEGNAYIFPRPFVPPKVEEVKPKPKRRGRKPKSK